MLIVDTKTLHSDLNESTKETDTDKSEQGKHLLLHHSVKQCSEYL